MTIKSNSKNGKESIEQQQKKQVEKRFKSFKDEVKEMSLGEMELRQKELANRVSKLHEYKEFIATLSEAQVGDEINSQGSLIEVVKRTPQGHLDFNIYELNVDSKTGEESKGKWKGKNRFTQKDLENSIALALREEGLCLKELDILKSALEIEIIDSQDEALEDSE